MLRETRCRHPMSDGMTIEQAMQCEQGVAALAARARRLYVIDAPRLPAAKAVSVSSHVTSLLATRARRQAERECCLPLACMAFAGSRPAFDVVRLAQSLWRAGSLKRKTAWTVIYDYVFSSADKDSSSSRHARSCSRSMPKREEHARHCRNRRAPQCSIARSLPHGAGIPGV